MSSRLSRRRALGLGAAALASTGLPTRPPTALARRPTAPAPTDFAMPVPGPGGRASAARGGLVTEVLEAPHRFDLVGLRWRDAGGLDAEIRFRRGGRWSRWMQLGSIGEHAPDGERTPSATAPVWVGRARAFQLRLSRRPHKLRAHFVSARRGPPGAGAARRRASAALEGDPPPIVTRDDWNAQGPRSAASYGEVKLAFVHHTVTANGYSRAESAAVVRSIQHYHRNVLGWNDIGYNALVDRYGQIFEGREGGVDQPVIGAQAQGYNGVSTGVANLGTFSGSRQTAAGVGATAELLAWKLSLHGAPAEGSVEVTSAGGPSNRHRDGTRVTFRRIAGHRGADKTTCPGDALFSQLGEIRAQAAELAPQYAFLPPAGAVSLATTDSTLDHPQAAQLSGRATGAGGVALVNAPISLQFAAGSGFVTVVRTTTGIDGTWTAQLQTQYSRSLRAVARLPDGALVGSPPLELQVAPRLALRVPKRVTALRSFTVRGTISPRRPRATLVIARNGSDGAMRTVARIAVKVRGGRFTTQVRLRRAALHRMRVTFAGDGRNSAARSADVLLRATRPR